MRFRMEGGVFRWAGCLAVVLWAAGAVAAAPGWSRRVWTTDDGLPVNGLVDVVQTPDGYVWVASYGGLVRFDGVRFEVFDRARGLPDDRLTRLAVAPDGRLLGATSRQVAFVVERGAVSVLPWAVKGFVERPGELWLGTEVGLMRAVAGGFVRVGPAVAGAVSGAFDAAGGLWVGTEARGLLRVVGDEVVAVALVGADGRAAETVYAVVLDGAGTLWVGADVGLFRVVDGRAVAVPVVGCEGEGVLAVSPVGGDVWLGTACGTWALRAGEGAARVVVAGEGGTVLHRPVLVGAGGALVVRTARSVRVGGEVVFEGAVGAHLVDGEGAVWVSSTRGELVYLRRQPVGALDDGGLAPNAYGMAEGAGGDLWVASLGAGVLRFRGDRVVAQVVGGDARFGGRAGAVVEDGAGVVWVGGAALFRVEGGRAVAVAEGDVRLLHVDGAGALWVGSEHGLFRRGAGLAEAQGSAGEGVAEFAEVQGPAGEAVAGEALAGAEFGEGQGPAGEALAGAGFAEVRGPAGEALAGARGAYEAGGVLWLAVEGRGLLRVERGRARVFGAAEGLPSALVRGIAGAADGGLWLGTEDRGLVYCREAGAGLACRAVRRADGLFADHVHAVVDDGRGWLWMSCNQGIFRVAAAELAAFVAGRAASVASVPYGTFDGLPHREANGGASGAGLRLRDGRIVFPTQAGVAVIDPARITPARGALPVQIEAVRAGSAAVPWRSGRLVLGPGQRDFRVSYSAPSFAHPEQVRFRYRLAGFDGDWQAAGGRREAFYTRLPPGRYRFEVQAADGDRGFAAVGAALGVTVTPRFSETGWFVALVALGGVALLAGLWRLRFARMRARAEALEAVVAARTAELARQAKALAALDEVKTRFFAHISHELRTPLAMIAGVAAQLAGEGPDRPLVAALGRNTARLQRLCDQILALVRGDAGARPARRVPVALGAVVEGTVAAFRPVVARRFSVAVEAGAAALGDPEMVETVVMNLVSNAVKFTGEGGAVTVRAGVDGGRAWVEVEDDGRGIPAEDLPRIFDRFYRVESATLREGEGAGLGLALVEELVRQQGGAVTVESRVGVGSRFRVVLPACGVEVAGAVEGAGAAEVGARARGEALLLAAPEGAEGAEGADDADDARPRVLVVDDNADLRAFVGGILAPRYAVLSAADGVAGLARARAALPDVVVADVMMPGLDGVGLVAALAGDPDTACIPVLLLTARVGTSAEVEGLRAGAVDYLGKPFAAEVLRARVDGILARRARLRDALRRELAAEAPGEAAAAEAPGEAAAGEVAGMAAGEASPGEAAVLGAAAAAGEAAEAELDAALDEGAPDGAAAAVTALCRAVIEARIDDEALDVPALARAVGMSKATLTRRLADEGGPSPGALIRAVRLDRARTLLEAGRGNVSEVAFAVGFNSLAQFSRTFKATYGATPSRWAAG